MTTANCTNCGATATGTTFTEASAILNHAIGLSRGIMCGDNYNCVVEVKDSSKKVEAKDTSKKVESKSNDTKLKPTDKPKTSKSY